MSTVAEQLRTAREAKQLTVDQVADMTKIRTDHIRALEEGNFDVFSAQIYIRGSVKNYATMLKMDVPAVLQLLDAELERTKNFSEPPPLTEQKKTIVDHITLLLTFVGWKKAIIGLIVLAAIAITVVLVRNWKPHASSDPIKDLPPARVKSSGTAETIPLRK